MLALRLVETKWGWLGLAGSEKGLCGLTLPKPEAGAALEAIATDFPGGTLGDFTGEEEAEAQLKRYFEGERIAFSVTLDLPARPPFWKKVWDVVAQIPYGATSSYGAVAVQAGTPGAARAVGGAMAHNPVPIIIPCHRVIGGGGGLTGFGGGLDMKRRMLEMEALALKGSQLSSSRR